jgi:predicted adenylyl cyclase CyaB
MKQKKQIEIELRGLIDKKQHDKLNDFLSKNAEDLGTDNKDTRFFLLPNKVFKVVNNTSKKTAKIVFKSNRVGGGKADAEEIEIPIKQSDFKRANKLFSHLEFDEVQKSFQKRHNYLYKGVEFAIKHTKVWGFHVELEILVNNESYKKSAEEKIRKVAKELNIPIMSKEEIKEFAKKIDNKYKAKNKKSLIQIANEGSKLPDRQIIDQETPGYSRNLGHRGTQFG